MKPLLTIIILLSCMSVCGQTQYQLKDGALVPVPPVLIDEFYYFDYPPTDGGPTFITYESITSDWKAYKDECYADSTATKKYKWAVHDFGTGVDTVWHFWSINKPDKNTIYSNSWIVGDSIFYMHNNKPTFEGFMDYMERKYKPTND